MIHYLSVQNVLILNERKRVMKKSILVLLCCSAFIVFATAVRAEEIKEGKWSMTMVTKMEGMPPEAAQAMKEMENMPPEAMAMMKKMSGKMNFQMAGDAQGITTTVTQCVTNKNPVPDAKMPEKCQQTHTINGNTVNFQVSCNAKDTQIDSTGQVTYKGDTMQGNIKSRQVINGKSMDAAIQINGKYLGPCS